MLWKVNVYFCCDLYSFHVLRINNNISYFIIFYIWYWMAHQNSFWDFNIQTKNDDPFNHENQNLFDIKIQINFIFKTHKHHHFQCFNWMFNVYMICCCSFNWFIQFIYSLFFISFLVAKKSAFTLFFIVFSIIKLIMFFICIFMFIFPFSYSIWSSLIPIKTQLEFTKHLNC